MLCHWTARGTAGNVAELRCATIKQLWSSLMIYEPPRVTPPHYSTWTAKGTGSSNTGIRPSTGYVLEYVHFGNYTQKITEFAVIAGLHTHIYRNCEWQISARVSQTFTVLLPLPHIAADAIADEYWRLHRSECLNTLIYAHMTLRTQPSCDINLNSLTLLAPEAGDVVEIILLYLISS